MRSQIVWDVTICSEYLKAGKGKGKRKGKDKVKDKGKDKGKGTPLQSWTGPEGSRRLRLPDFKTIVT